MIRIIEHLPNYKASNRPLTHRKKAHVAEYIRHQAERLENRKIQSKYEAEIDKKIYNCAITLINQSGAPTEEERIRYAQSLEREYASLREKGISIVEIGDRVAGNLRKIRDEYAGRRKERGMEIKRRTESVIERVLSEIE